MARPLLLFAHGAGLGSTSPWMLRWRGYLSEVGDVVAFDYPYMAAGKRRPDPPARLLDAHADALRDARAAHPGQPVVLIGKSMGSRMGCHLANDPEFRPLVSAVVTLGYPLVGAGKTRKVRDEVLVDLRTPILFVAGTRDPLCPLDLLAQVRPRMKAPSELFVVEGGDHSLHLRKRDLAEQGLSQEEADRQAVASIKSYLRGVVA